MWFCVGWFMSYDWGLFILMVWGKSKLNSFSILFLERMILYIDIVIWF